MEYQINKRKKKTGGQEMIIIIAIIGLSISLTGGFYLRNQPGPPLRGSVASSHGVLCCDTGNGPNCKPQTDPAHPILTYNNVTYGLLKSNTTFNDCGKHLRASGQTFQGNPIVLDVSNEYNSHPGTDECGPLNSDTLADWRSGAKVCYPIPNDELVYVCVANCNTHSNPSCDTLVDPRNFYGDGTTVFNVYFRLSDYGVARTSPDRTPNGVPDIVQNCAVPSSAWNPSENQQNKNAGGVSPTIVQAVMTPLPYPTHHSEQLHTFTFGYPNVASSGPVQWIRPWCKPAVYLYPPKTESVHVKIAPKGNIMATIPSYPKDGWEVLANPDGSIVYNNTTYPYLYYEAGISDELLPNNKTGYVRPYDQLGYLFKTLLPQLGLNEKETKDFSAYWVKTLPKSPYYLVSIVPEQTLNAISPLFIMPKPDSQIRVTLDFEPLDKKISVPQPDLHAIKRQGFTVVEWGGLFKKDKNHPFHCLQ